MGVEETGGVSGGRLRRDVGAVQNLRSDEITGAVRACMIPSGWVCLEAMGGQG